VDFNNYDFTKLFNGEAQVDGGGSFLEFTPNNPPNIAINVGDAQTGATGINLPAPLAVKLIDGAGNPIPGVDVFFNVIQGTGQLSNGFGNITVTTDVNGIASTSYRPSNGANQIAVSGAQGITVNPQQGVLFTATGN